MPGAAPRVFACRAARQLNLRRKAGGSPRRPPHRSTTASAAAVACSTLAVAYFKLGPISATQLDTVRSRPHVSRTKRCLIRPADDHRGRVEVSATFLAASRQMCSGGTAFARPSTVGLTVRKCGRRRDVKFATAAPDAALNSSSGSAVSSMTVMTVCFVHSNNVLLGPP